MIRLGRYELFDVIAHGGMASVHLGRLLGDAAFVRVVAIKRLHPQFSRDPEFVGMLRDEARLASRIRHPNVVAVTDIVAEDGELSLVMDYIPGESLARLVKSGRVPPAIASSIMLGILAGLHAAHEACDGSGRALDLVHRDVSPHNIIVGTDGLAHVIDFGIAKARGRSTMTREGELKGKIAYMAPEQIGRGHVSRAADIYAAAATLWEVLTGRRLFDGDSEASLVVQVLSGASELPSSFAGDLPPRVDDVIMRGLARDPSRRYPTARAMAEALEQALPPAPRVDVADWLDAHAHDALVARARATEAVERGDARAAAPPAAEPPVITHATRRGSMRIVFAALGLAVVCGSVGGVLAFGGRRSGVAAPPASASVPAELPGPSATVVPVPAAPTTATIAASATTSSSPSAASPSPRIRTRPARATSCDPPYTTLENGRKVFKRECL